MLEQNDGFDEEWLREIRKISTNNEDHLMGAAIVPVVTLKDWSKYNFEDLIFNPRAIDNNIKQIIKECKFAF